MRKGGPQKGQRMNPRTRIHNEEVCAVLVTLPDAGEEEARHSVLAMLRRMRDRRGGCTQIGKAK